jgi:hypothetical protein
MKANNKPYLTIRAGETEGLASSIGVQAFEINLTN